MKLPETAAQIVARTAGSLRIGTPVARQRPLKSMDAGGLSAGAEKSAVSRKTQN
jgi:hypothetical protein